MSNTEGLARRSGRKARRSQASAKSMTIRQMAPTSSGAGQAPMKATAAAAVDGTISA